MVMRPRRLLVILAVVLVGACAADKAQVESTGDVGPPSQVVAGSAVDPFTVQNLERSSSIVLGEIVDERPGMLHDPVAAFSPDDCEPGIPECVPPSGQPVIQQYDAVIGVETTVFGAERSEGLIRRYRSVTTSPDGHVTEHAEDFEVGDRVLVSLIPGVDGEPDHSALVLTLRDGYVASNHYNHTNTFRAEFDGLSESEAIDLIRAVAADGNSE